MTPRTLIHLAIFSLRLASCSALASAADPPFSPSLPKPTVENGDASDSYDTSRGNDPLAFATKRAFDHGFGHELGRSGDVGHPLDKFDQVGNNEDTEAATTQERNLGKLSTIAISSFILELTMQNLGRSLRARNLDSSDLVAVDELLKSVAENHLAAVYSDALIGIPPPTQVLLNIVTIPDNDGTPKKTGGIYIRQSFLGGVVSFPVGSADSPSRSALNQLTLEAFRIPGLGEDFLTAVRERSHPDLAGLILISASSVTQDDEFTQMIGDGKQTENIPINPLQNDITDDANDGTMNNIWAIAAVAALGAMFVTIILCTTVLYCDWRKRRQRKKGKRLISASPQRTKSPINGGGADVLSADRASMRIVVPADSGETENGTPSPSSRGSDESKNSGPAKAAAAIVSSRRGSLIGNSATGRGSLIGNMIGNKSARGVVALRSHTKAASAGLMSVPTTSKAAGEELKQADGPAEDESYIPEVAPSVTYSVGEDTTALYPTINRGRANSRDLESNFDEYSVDAASALEPYSYETPSANHRNKPVPRDFDSVWDDKSQLSASVVGGPGNAGAADDDTIAESIGDRTPLPPVGDDQKKSYIDLTKSLSQLADNHNDKSKTGGEYVNLYDFDSESESGSNRGAFTLELLGQKSRAKGTFGSTPDEDDSILGDMYSQDGMSQADESTFSEEVKTPSSADSVDSTPSWAVPIPMATRRATVKTSNIASNESNSSSPRKSSETNSKVFRKSSVAPLPVHSEVQSEDDLSAKESSERTKDKFVSSLSKSESSDDKSASASQIGGTNGPQSVKNGGTRRPALGHVRSAEDSEDDDPAHMLESINSMLSECRVILDNEKL